MRRDIGQLLRESFVSVVNVVGGLLGIILTVVLFVVVPLDLAGRILVGALALYISISLIVIVTLYQTLLHQSRVGKLPRILMGRDPFPGTSATLVCIAEPSEFFHFGIWVSFYRLRARGFEEPIGTGHVINVQEDGKILLQMERVFREHEDFAEKVRNNDPEALESLRVKPYVPRQMFGSYEEYI
jgi:hypothetical protein